MTRVLVLTGVELEARALARHLDLVAAPNADWPHFRRGALEVACIGLAGVRLAALGERLGSPDLVVAAGTCGALAPDLAEGALVVPELVIAPDGQRVGTHRTLPLGHAGTLLTVDRVVETAADKARLWIETGALAVDMESAAILTWARARGVPACVVRGVSDTAARGVPAELAALVGPEGVVDTGRALRTVLAHPRTIGHAWALRRGTDAALRAVASTLAALPGSR